MKIADDVHLIASGSAGALYTHPLDCNAYAIRCGEESYGQRNHAASLW